MKHADVLIVGAGCAGLSLAHRLIEAGLEGRRLVLIEPRAAYARDRTFCGWSVAPHPYEGAVSHRWSRWRLRDGAREVVREAPGLTYDRLSADRFYAAAIGAIEGDASAELVRGVWAGAIHEGRDRTVVETSRGAFSARWVFDSRPPPRRVDARPGRTPAMLQSFVGWEVETARDRFDPEVATLMDFAPSALGLHFVYLLPLSAREALVEATWFGARPVPDEDAIAEIERYLRAAVGVESFVCRHVERGVLPMDSRRPHRSSAAIPIGAAAGATRPASGYAFGAIQRHSAAIARAVIADSAIPNLPRGKHLEQLDRALLSYLCRHPERGARLFVRLFERADPRTLARFLEDLATPTECVHIMGAAAEPALALETLRSAVSR